MIPIVGFLEGDTIGLLILADDQITMEQLGKKLQIMARVRVAPMEHFQVVYNQQPVEMNTTVAQLGVQPLDRIDVRHHDGFR